MAAVDSKIEALNGALNARIEVLETKFTAMEGCMQSVQSKLDQMLGLLLSSDGTR